MTCPVCRREVAAAEELEARGLEPEVVELVAANAPGWRLEQGLCADCARLFEEAHREARARPVFVRSGWRILPTPLRLDADRAWTGRGVTIAFLDAGFHAHPDLVEPRNRILHYADVNNPRTRLEDLERPEVSSWHGMMTSVVACGNGRLSEGFYRGLAPDADVVLVKVGSARRIVHEDLQKGFDWVVRNRRRFGIRIVNVSCGGDFEASYLVDGLSQAAERATRSGLLVCAAAGNAGRRPDHPVLPPASAPSVLTVGGLDDQNRLDPAGFDLYPGSWGPTVDGLQKPEVLAPGIWVAAPILPGTPTAEQARLYATLAGTADRELRAAIAARPGVDPDLDQALALAPPLVRRLVDSKLRDGNIISGAYKHVDGTSFASPIVASLAAQMLEASPELTPAQLKCALIRTAIRLPRVEVDRQGWGVVQARAAVAAARAAGRLEGALPRAGRPPTV